MRKLLLRCGFSPGDIVMLTAAVRDLHRCYPGRFQTAVRTSCQELWENNPYLTTFLESEKGVQEIFCDYPLIDVANNAPYHCLHGFIHFLNSKLALSIEPSEFRGDIHLSTQEKAWHSQVHEFTGEDTPFWIINAGGKFDVPIKWWDAQRFQEVVDHFRKKILFVQIGDWGHHHPRLEGVLDLRGQTSLRELIRLVYHAQGVLCPVTAVMHLAAAVETKPGMPANRPCVVVAGGREPPNWEAYPHHQFIHTVGALHCCAQGGCWRDRTVPLHDGDKRDGPEHRCMDLAGSLPRCMSMITAKEVIGRIESYFSGGTVHYLSSSQARAARRGIRQTRSNEFDDQPLTIHNSRAALEERVQAIGGYPARAFAGRGIVICGGGLDYFTNAWVCIRILRHLGCALPVELWHLDSDEMDPEMKRLVHPLGVTCVSASSVRERAPVRRLCGWGLKPYAILHSRFAEVLLLDADNVPVVDPSFLFDSPEYRSTGALFWPDYHRDPEAERLWVNCGIPRPDTLEFESGQILVDKGRCWKALTLALWFNEHSDFFYRHIYGDKETFHLAFRKLEQPFCLVPHPIHTLENTMCQHDFRGRRLFQHRNGDKWALNPRNKRIADFWFEDECFQFLNELRTQWDGRYAAFIKKAAPGGKRFRARPPKIVACMISCKERDRLRTRTLTDLARTDWEDRPVLVQLDLPKSNGCPKERQTSAALCALRRALLTTADLILFLEDDLLFNKYFRHNLLTWPPIREGSLAAGSLYNPGLRAVAYSWSRNSAAVPPENVFGSQALILSRAAAQHVTAHWHEAEGMQDIRISRLGGAFGGPLLYHDPSLVQHVGRKSAWGGTFHQSRDFSRTWRRE